MATTTSRVLPATWSDASCRLGVLVVLAGVLAMHALAGGSHMAMARAAEADGRPMVSTAAGVNLMAVSAPGHRAAWPDAVVASRPGSTHGPLAAAASAAVLPSGVHAACLAVLLGLVLLAARAAFGVRRLLPATGARSAGHSSAPLGRGPPGQLLAQLCVLRT